MTANILPDHDGFNNPSIQDLSLTRGMTGLCNK